MSHGGQGPGSGRFRSVPASTFGSAQLVSRRGSRRQRRQRSLRRGQGQRLASRPGDPRHRDAGDERHRSHGGPARRRAGREGAGDQQRDRKRWTAHPASAGEWRIRLYHQAGGLQPEGKSSFHPRGVGAAASRPGPSYRNKEDPSSGSCHRASSGRSPRARMVAAWASGGGKRL